MIKALIFNQVVSEIVLNNKSIGMIYIPIIIWAVLVTIYLIVLSRKYTFGNWSQENPNPYCNETMGLPRGVMRGILTLTILFVVVLLEVYTLHDPAFEGRIKEFMIAFQMVLAFYFGSQVMNYITSADKTKTVAIAESVAQVRTATVNQSTNNNQASEPEVTEKTETIPLEFNDPDAIG